MIRAARERLAAQAVAAGYPPATLATIAEAALPGYRPGDRLDDAAIDHVRTAVEILAQAGHPAEELPALIADHRDRHDAHGWREQFWRHQLQTACRRFNHAALHGSEPCERAG